MPAKKKVAAKAPVKKASPTFEEAVLSLGADFEGDECLALAKSIYEEHGASFVAAVKKRKDAIPISLLQKVISKESKGETVKLKARKSIKDKAE